MDLISALPSIDDNSPLPKYQQLKTILLDAINRGAFPQGELLPTERELEERFRVSRITVRQALRDLVNGGYLRREAGRGTFVIRADIHDTPARPVGTFMDVLQASGHHTGSEILRCGWQTPPPAIAELFESAGKEECFTFERLMFADGVPVTLVENWLDLRQHELNISAATLQGAMIWDVLDQHGIALTTGEQTLQAISADERDAGLLQIEPGAPLMLREVMMRTSRGRLLVVSRAMHVGHTYKFHTWVNR
jgi:GntR family transcriptional regulator